MQIRGISYSIRELLIESDVDLYSLEAKEQEIVISFFYDHLDQFKECIQYLIQSYEKLITETDMNFHENGVLNISIELHKQLQTISSFIENSNQRLQKHSQQIQKMTDLPNPQIFFYLTDMKKLNTFMLTMKESLGFLNTLTLRTNEMIDQFDDFGILKIQRRLIFFINLFLKPLYQLPNVKRNFKPVYPSILKSLAEFCYNHGKNIFVVDETESDHEASVDRHVGIHIDMSLKLFMMSGLIETSTLENACYIHILDKISNANTAYKAAMSQFDLEKFARNSPDEFVKLYYYLSKKNVFLIKHFNHTYNEYSYLTFKVSLFNLYLSFALQQLAENNKAVDYVNEFIEQGPAFYRERAKTLLLACLNMGMKPAALALKKYFHELEVYIKVAIYFFEVKKRNSPSTNTWILSTISSLTQEKLFLYADYLSPLFRCWLQQDDTSLKSFALKAMSFYVKNDYALAEQILYECAKKDVQCAVIYSDIIIETNNLMKMQEAFHVLLESNAHSTYESEVNFNLYRLMKMKNGFNCDYFYLFKAAETGSKCAIDEIILIYRKNISLKLDEMLFYALKRGSAFAYQILMDHSRDLETDLELAICTLQHERNDGASIITKVYLACTDQLAMQKLNQENLLKFYYSLIKYTDDLDRIAFATKELMARLRTSDYAYECLSHFAQYDLSLAIYLVHFYLQEENHSHRQHKKLLHLKAVIEIYYEDHVSPEADYCIYLVDKMINKKININLLRHVLRANADLALDEFMLIFKTFQKNKKTYSIYQDNAKTDIHCAILYFKSELIKYAMQDGPHQYTAAEILSLYYIHHNEFLLSENYLRVCLTINLDNIQNHINFDKKIHHFSPSFKQFYLENKRNAEYTKTFNHRFISNPLKHKLSFFISNTNSNHVTFEKDKTALRTTILTAPINPDLRLELIEQLQFARYREDLLRIHSQLIELPSERIKAHGKPG